MMKSTANHWRFSSRSLKKSTPARLATSIVAMLKLGNTTTAGRSCKERRRNFAEKKLGIPMAAPKRNSRMPGRSFLYITKQMHSKSAKAKV